jgi:DNA repair protein RecN (Recombination protein N)
MLGLHLASEGEEGEEGPGTAIFDEVDAGIGGATARVIGERLARAACHQQVICVTHLPQIAALAQRHLQVAKAVAGGRAVTSVSSLAGEDRVLEVARMLGEGGSPATARRHAEALLAESLPLARQPAAGRRRRERWA